jgi:hypothetical protein
METNELITTLSDKSDDELRSLAAQNYELANALLMSHPEMAQDAGFELFGRDWANRYWRNVISQVSGIHAMDRVYSWAVGASISEVAKLIIQHYSLPAVAATSAVALAILLLRAARQQSNNPKSA